VKANSTNPKRYLHRTEPLVIAPDLPLLDGGTLLAQSTATPEDLILVGRPEGERLLPTLIAALKAMPPRSILPIDCGRVRIMDMSFADETLVKLSRRCSTDEFGPRYFFLENVREEVETNLKAVFKVREVFLPVQLSVPAASGGVLSAEGPSLLGDIGLEMRETYQVALRQGKLTARDLVELLPDARLSIAAASNRLTRLVKGGALAELDSEIVEGGGRQKVFAPIY
jgi:hypothetical protein